MAGGLSHRENHLAALRRLYDELARQHGDSLVSVQRPRGRQDLILGVLLAVCEGKQFSILDVGCGVGFLWEYLKRYGYDCRYTGLDLSGEMIRICRTKFAGDQRATFVQSSLEEFQPAEGFDYAVASGTFNNNPSHLPHDVCWSLVQDSLRRMFELCRRAVAANFASSYVDYVQEGSFHVAPEGVFTFAKSLTRRVALRHDYMPYEFTVFLFKDDRVSPNNVFQAVEQSCEMAPPRGV